MSLGATEADLRLAVLGILVYLTLIESILAIVWMARKRPPPGLW